jgi:hypothetical protein
MLQAVCFPVLRLEKQCTVQPSCPFLRGESWYAKLKEQFDIEIIVIQIPEELKNSILQAQKRQYR